MNPMMTLSQMLGGAARVWLEVALLAGLFVALLFRPERVRSVSALQTAAALFALSIIIPSILPLFAESASPRGGQPGGFGAQAGQLDLVSKASLALGPALFGFSIVAALFALMPSAKENGEPQSKSAPAATAATGAGT